MKKENWNRERLTSKANNSKTQSNIFLFETLGTTTVPFR